MGTFLGGSWNTNPCGGTHKHLESWYSEIHFPWPHEKLIGFPH